MNASLNRAALASALTQPQQPAQHGPLAGVRVLDLTGIVLGPFATQMLGDYGADVIKVEPPEGDLTRANGVSRGKATVGGMSSIFLAINRNKRSLAIDLKRAAGSAALRRLLPTVDVLVHNMRNAAIERLGFGYADCAAVAPNLICCVATGFGEDGPDAGKPALDDIIQAACGLVGLTSEAGGGPAHVPSLIADKTAGRGRWAGMAAGGRTAHPRSSIGRRRLSRLWLGAGRGGAVQVRGRGRENPVRAGDRRVEAASLEGDL